MWPIGSVDGHRHRERKVVRVAAGLAALLPSPSNGIGDLWRPAEVRRHAAEADDLHGRGSALIGEAVLAMFLFTGNWPSMLGWLAK